MKTADLFQVNDPKIRALHLTWAAFFLCFYTWFNMAPLATTIARELGWLTQKDIGLLAICNIALTIPVRVFVGMALDKWGPRRVFSFLMITMSVPVFLFAFGNSLAQLLVSRLVLGCIGAGFVVGVHMTGLWFAPKDIGFAQGIYAGWGNFGAMVASVTLPAIVLHLFVGEGGWRDAIAANGFLLLLYGVVYWFAITDGPKGIVLRKPRRVAAMEVSNYPDMILLIIGTLPIIGSLALLTWKIEQMGYLSVLASRTAYVLIAAGILYQVVQILRINIPLLKKGVPKDDQYHFRSVMALNLSYFANFGALLAVISMLPAFFETTFHLSPTFAGLLASFFPLGSFFARPLAGYISDRAKRRKGVMAATMLGISVGFIAMGFMNASWPIAVVVIVTLLCSIFVEGSTGATFAIIPMVKRRLTGQISGMAGAYGNVGGLFYLTIYSVVGPQPFFFVLAAGAFISFLVCVFFLKEPSREHHLSSVDRAIEGEDILRNVNLDDDEDAKGGNIVASIMMAADFSVNKFSSEMDTVSDIEMIKQEGLGLDFDRITEVGTRALLPGDYYRLRTYGFCVQKHPGYFILRIRIPGGRATSKQLKQLAAFAEAHGRGSVHLTARQEIELHFVRLEDAIGYFDQIRAMGFSTRSTDGHTLRNIIACPHGTISGTQPGANYEIDAQSWAKRISDFFVSQSDRINPTMPNRLNILISACNECNAYAKINDIGLIAVSQKMDNGEMRFGFEVWVGGSLGSNPALGFMLKPFIEPNDLLAACQAILEMYTIFSNRTPGRSRLKCLIEEWGVQRFTDTFEPLFHEKKHLQKHHLSDLFDGMQPPHAMTQRWNRFLSTIVPFGTFGTGIIPQRQSGYARLILAFPFGKVSSHTLSAISQIAKRHGNGHAHFTQDQDIELHWIPLWKIRQITKMLNAIGVSLKEDKKIIACLGSQFCPLGITDAQGTAQNLLRQYHPDDAQKKALYRSISIRISGCLNGCAKHQIGDIGLVGAIESVGDLNRYTYQIYLGGNLNGMVQYGERIKCGITEALVIPSIDALITIALAHRLPEETFHETVARIGTKKVAELLEERLAPLVEEEIETLEMIPFEEKTA